MTTFGLSVAGFVLSIIANVWAFGLTFVRWPRVSVETRAHLFSTAGPSEDKIVLTVINRGAEAVTVSDIGLRAEDGSQSHGFEYDGLHQPQFLPDGEALPVRLKGHGALRWIYGPQQLADFKRGIQVRGYAKVYKSFNWRPKVSFRWPKVSFRWRSEITERTIDAPRTAQIDSGH